MQLWLRLPLFWRFQLAGWTVFVIVTFPLKIVLSGSVTSAAILCVVRDGSSFLLTVILHRIYRACWSDQGGRVAALIVVSCALAGLLQSGFFLLLRPVVSTKGEFLFAHSLEFSVLYERMGLLYGWSFLYFGIRHAIESIRQKLRLTLIESEKRAAQLQMLRAQMNPHFLFNALNTIRAGVEKANAQLGVTVQSLADFLRFSLDHSNEDFIPLGREFDAVRHYLQVEKARFHDKLDFECDTDESARAVPVPGIILQPLVENAVKYGQETSDNPLRVRVRVTKQADAINIIVGNTGRWLEPASREKANHLGLQNLRHRLELLYPGKPRLNISETAGWVTVSILLPIL